VIRSTAVPRGNPNRRRRLCAAFIFEIPGVEIRPEILLKFALFSLPSSPAIRFLHFTNPATAAKSWPPQPRTRPPPRESNSRRCRLSQTWTRANVVPFAPYSAQQLPDSVPYESIRSGTAAPVSVVKFHYSAPSDASQQQTKTRLPSSRLPSRRGKSPAIPSQCNERPRVKSQCYYSTPSAVTACRFSRRWQGLVFLRCDRGKCEHPPPRDQ
jgi:hypothetical protein